MKITEIASNTKLDKKLKTLRSRKMGAIMHNLTELEFDEIGEGIIDYICPECFNLDKGHRVEEPCPHCDAPSHIG